MPIDSQIPLEFHPTQFGLINPLDAAAKRAEVQNAQAKTPLLGEELTTARMENRQRQMQFDSTRALNEALRTSTSLDPKTGLPVTDYDKAQQGLVANGFGTTAQSLAKGVAAAQKTRADLAKLTDEHNEKQADAIGVGAKAMQEGGYDPTAVAGWAHGLQSVYPQQAAEILDAVQNHPDQLKALVDRYAFNSQALRKGAPAALNAETNAAKFKLAKPELETKAATAAQELAARTVDPVSNQDQWDTWRARQTKSAQDSIPVMFSPAAKTQVQRMGVPVKDRPTYDLNSKRAEMGLMGNSEYDQFLGNYARGLGKTVTQLTPEEGMASVQKFNELKQGPQQIFQSYKLQNDELDKLGKPIDEVATKVGDLRDLIATGDSGNPQAWANVPAKVLSLTAGGQGSGLRMSTALLDQELGGAGKWAQLQGAFQAWNPDPKNASKISDAQKTQFRAILNAAEKRVQARQDIVNQGRQDLIDAKDINGHRTVVLGTRTKLAAADRAAGGQAATGAGVRYVSGGTTYNIPTAEVSDFLKDHPNAVKQ